MPSLCQLVSSLPSCSRHAFFFFFFWCEMLSLNISSLCSTQILTWYFRSPSGFLGIGAIIWYQSSMTSWWESVMRMVLAAQFSRWVSGYSVIYPLLCHCVWKMLSAGTWAKTEKLDSMVRLYFLSARMLPALKISRELAFC